MLDFLIENELFIFIGAIVLLFLIEILRLILKKSNKLFSEYSHVDVILFAISVTPFKKFFNLFFTFGAYTLIVDFYEFHLFDLTTIGSIYQFLILLFYHDFLRFFSHWFVHQNDFLWTFHSPHHVQKYFNVMLEFRFHPMDRLFRKSIVILALSLIKFDLKVFFIVTFIHTIYGVITHLNINFHPPILRHILVTPFIHRIHHTKEGQRKNMGAIFTIWDRIFGCYSEQFVEQQSPSEYEDKGFLYIFFNPYKAAYAQLSTLFKKSKVK